MDLKSKSSDSNTGADTHNMQVRLERVNKDLEVLRKKLNSYVCEPKTYGLFERMEQLQLRLEEVRNANDKIISGLRSGGKTFEKEVTKQLHNFRALEQGIAEYIAGARDC